MNDDLIRRSDAVKVIREKASGYYNSWFAADEECNDIIKFMAAVGCSAEINSLPAVEAVSKAVYDDLYAKYCELARLTNEVYPQFIEALREFNANAPKDNTRAKYYLRCLKCHKKTRWSARLFCPRCGARMEVKKRNEN